MQSPVLFDVSGRRRSPATLPGFHAGRPPRNKGLRYPADPPPVEEIVAVMRQAGARSSRSAAARPGRGALAFGAAHQRSARAHASPTLTVQRGSVLVRCGKGGKRREVGMDPWGWEHLAPWLDRRLQLPVGALFCVISGPTQGRPWSSAAVRVQLRRLALTAGVRRRFARTNCVTPTPSRWPAKASR